ncbi:Toll/IL1-receptor protein [Cotia virus SPAn232]|uniref:Toll/IL1-receptor protein n=2 Tax=Cotia virus TaxID=39444 RepID=H6TAC0_9POXV|nr:Toll/IL1-receptor protein [Cotia virus SPAn232]AFB76954.1 Toll/IL1-receptor protein [Cotia virus SPAn232]AIT70767.1 Toll/IL1-receptor protein [Cotia virus]
MIKLLVEGIILYLYMELHISKNIHLSINICKMTNLVRFEVNIVDNKISIVIISDKHIETNITYKEMITPNNYIHTDNILDSDDMYVVLNNYLWYRGFVGYDANKYGRVFKELLKFDSLARVKYGNIETLFNMLNLNSNNGIDNFTNFLSFQKKISNVKNEFDFMQIIGLCALVAEHWKKNKKCLNWFVVSDTLFNVLNSEQINEVKKILQNRLIYNDI